ncbi:MAG: hypothetical protein ACWGON_02095 [Gemmatimonadota bacterium]
MEGTTIPPELIGNAVITVAFVLVAWALLREAAKWTIRLALVFGFLIGVAILTGLLDNTAASGILYWVGASFGNGVRAVVIWLAETWQGLTGVGEPIR